MSAAAEDASGIEALKLEGKSVAETVARCGMSGIEC